MKLYVPIVPTRPRDLVISQREDLDNHERPLENFEFQIFKSPIYLRDVPCPRSRVTSRALRDRQTKRARARAGTPEAPGMHRAFCVVRLRKFPCSAALAYTNVQCLYTFNMPAASRGKSSNVPRGSLPRVHPPILPLSLRTRDDRYNPKIYCVLVYRGSRSRDATEHSRSILGDVRAPLPTTERRYIRVTRDASQVTSASPTRRNAQIRNAWGRTWTRGRCLPCTTAGRATNPRRDAWRSSASTRRGPARCSCSSSRRLRRVKDGHRGTSLLDEATGRRR